MKSSFFRIHIIFLGEYSPHKFLGNTQFYLAGICKYEESCKFNHSKSEAEKSPLQLNIFGFPKRLGKMNCSF
ncbi:hypothetical protein L1987_46554 [Smallanthus sonchifolius]|uniref:Uncharacterized protein n=1 Tax=Smallanthus sonchifolius TaxID=185202 RepID=A0ACB9G129_9ASTR|nr:hypothetical protein L1987_46554 [Smallanthus sonchifolius]